MYNLSSAQGARFAEVCEEMTVIVKGLGPSPLTGKQAVASEPLSVVPQAPSSENSEPIVDR